MERQIERAITGKRRGVNNPLDARRGIEKIYQVWNERRQTFDRFYDDDEYSRNLLLKLERRKLAFKLK